MTSQWHLELDGAESAYPNNLIEYIYKKLGYLIWTFISGSPAYLMGNIKSLKSIVNVSHCKLYSLFLSWKDDIARRDMEQMIEEAAQGQVVLLPYLLDYVNVLIDGVMTWNDSDSLLGTEAFVIPVQLSKIKAHNQGSWSKGPLQMSGSGAWICNYIPQTARHHFLISISILEDVSLR